MRDATRRAAEGDYSADVDVKSGEVTLEGTVDSKDAKRRAEDIVEACPGVKDVENRLRVRFRVDGQAYEYDDLPKLKKAEKHDIDVVIDRVKVRADIKQRLAESFEAALRLADGRAIAMEMDSGTEHLFNAKFACPICNYSISELEPRLFSFNSPVGACPSCDGLGHMEFFDPARVVAFPSLSLASGAIKGWDRRNGYYFALLESLGKHYKFSLDVPFEELAPPIQAAILLEKLIHFPAELEARQRTAVQRIRRGRPHPRTPRPWNS